MGTPGAFLYFPRDLRLRRRGAYSPRLTHGLRVVSPQGKRLTMICASLALLHPLLSLTHWIFRSLMLPYKSSSHSANHVRCAFASLKGQRPWRASLIYRWRRYDQTFTVLGAKDRQTYESDHRRPVHLKNLPRWTFTGGALHLISNPVFRCIQGTSIL